MTNLANNILEQALGLNSFERADVAEKLLYSLDAPNPKIDEAWANEANSRVNEYHKGNLTSLSVEDVFSKYEVK